MKRKKKTLNSTYKLIALVAILLAIVVCCLAGYNYYIHSGVSPVDGNVNYEDLLFQNALENSEDSNFTLDVELQELLLVDEPDSVPYYQIQLKGFDIPQGFKIGDLYGDDQKYEEIHEQTTFVKFSQRQELIIQSARSRVIKYIEDSTVLTDKERLIAGIENVPFYLYTESSHKILRTLDAPAVHCGNAIYCNKNYEDLFCEWILTHELFHHLRYLTSGSFSSERYYAMSFDEGITDVLTASTNPQIFSSGEYGNGYSILHEPLYKYFAIFGKDALRAYFYGYGDLFAAYASNFHTEHDAFTFALQYYGVADGPTACCEAFIKHWQELG